MGQFQSQSEKVNLVMFGGLNTNENHSFIAFGSQTRFSYFGYNGVLKAKMFVCTAYTQ